MNTKAMLAEFIGTFALIFVGVSAIAVGGNNPVGVALAHGLTIAVMGSATAAISGGHLNPAVTLAIWSAGRISTAGAIGYWIAQFTGGIAGAAIARYVHGSEAMALVGYGTPALGPTMTAPQAMVMEAILTFFLVFVVFGTTVDRRAPKVGALFIGLTVTLDIFAGGPLTGAAMNPARWLGPAMLGGGFENAWVYLAGPLLGGLVAAGVYKLGLMEREEAQMDIPPAPI